ncbi:Lsr2 family protein [Actinocorallia sp. A-T 12471]|uniref:histone-like nucleoid-structuring protein Lsr2 n=1 Tax=Actinocorallia sp. A-T 12471 TaxID=3089813 RepID=UPI0029CBCA94|nr:Lsr2 family protein [Actinocorallia sp. A-T 12471]MDX6741799.1 Lsr2 family protein [Actinocorallia sp. A-T 12471]
MARETIVRLVDDLDGGAADETVSFSLDGAAYEIDLSSENAKKLRDSLAAFVEHSRRAGAAKRGRAAGPAKRGASNRERSADIRAWAKGQGIKVNERGRIPASVVEQYDAAH